jgi:hypothetical protein
MGLGGPGQGGIEDQRLEVLLRALGIDERQEGTAQLLRIDRRRQGVEGGQDERRPPAEKQPLNPPRS